MYKLVTFFLVATTAACTTGPPTLRTWECESGTLLPDRYAYLHVENTVKSPNEPDIEYSIGRVVQAGSSELNRHGTNADILQLCPGKYQVSVYFNQVLQHGEEERRLYVDTGSVLGNILLSKGVKLSNEIPKLSLNPMSGESFTIHFTAGREYQVVGMRTRVLKPQSRAEWNEWGQMLIWARRSDGYPLDATHAGFWAPVLNDVPTTAALIESVRGD